MPNGAFGNCHNQSEWAILDWALRPGRDYATDRMMVQLAGLRPDSLDLTRDRNRLVTCRNRIGSHNRRQCVANDFVCV